MSDQVQQIAHSITPISIAFLLVESMYTVCIGAVGERKLCKTMEKSQRRTGDHEANGNSEKLHT